MTDETTPLIPTNERGAGPRTCGAQSEAARKSLRADVIAASAVLFFAGALVVAFPVHKHPHVPMDYYAKDGGPWTSSYVKSKPPRAGSRRRDKPPVTVAVES